MDQQVTVHFKFRYTGDRELSEVIREMITVPREVTDVEFEIEEVKEIEAQVSQAR